MKKSECCLAEVINEVCTNCGFYCEVVTFCDDCGQEQRDCTCVQTLFSWVDEIYKPENNAD